MSGLTMTILPDSSAWIDFLRGLPGTLAVSLHSNEDVAYTEPVLMEILLGARSKQERRQLRNFVTGASLVPFDSAADFEAAVSIHAFGRATGLTLGKTDCLILSVAQRTRASLLTLDRKQAAVGRALGLEILA